jgi:malonyl-CoA O-methyltransferase
MAIGTPSPLKPPAEGSALADPAAWAQAERRWAQGAALPWLHQEVARRMADRLSVIRAEPAVVLEWDALAGQSRTVLQAAYPRARWEPVGPVRVAPPLAASTPSSEVPPEGWAARLRQGLRGLLALAPGPGSVPAPSAGGPRLPVTTLEPHQIPLAHAQLLWSNLGLHAHADPVPVFQGWHKALAVDGFLMFSAFGPDTLKELRSLWGAQGWGPPCQDFRDMHDWGDDLVAAGFADPVMDQETITLTWTDADAALAELRTMGTNAHPARMAGCRTPRWLVRAKAALQERAGPGGRIALSFEIIYGHAFRPAPRARMEAVTAVSLDEMRSLVQSSRR